MSMQDPIADMLTRIRNAIHARKSEVCISFSRHKQDIIALLTKEGYLLGYTEVLDPKGLKSLIVKLKYYKNKGVIEMLQRVSRPSRRVYVPCSKVPRVYRGFGIAVISTPLGVITDRQARAHNVGGEVLCYVA